MEHTPDPLIVVIDDSQRLRIQAGAEQSAVHLAIQKGIEERSVVAKEAQLEFFQERPAVVRRVERHQSCGSGG